ncbi:MAG: nucleotidyltransferase [SAR324 cluster bacterium]|nr:nucleotidyltransferase [SAR324 cluster bacterium]
MPELVILAAGWGSRYGGLKQVDSFGPNGESLLDYAVYDAWLCGFSKLHIVISPEMEDTISQKIKELPFSALNCHIIVQSKTDVPHLTKKITRLKPWGTAHALYACRNHLTTPFALINADDFYGRFSFKATYDFLTSTKSTTNDYSLVGFRLANCLSKNGVVSRGICQVKQGKLLGISERFGLKKNLDNIILDEAGASYSGDEKVSMNCWGFTPQILDFLTKEFDVFLNHSHDLANQEFMLPTVIKKAIANNLCQVKVLSAKNNPFGITYKEDKPLVQKLLLDLHAQGEYPPSLKSYTQSFDESKKTFTRSLRRNRLLQSN